MNRSGASMRDTIERPGAPFAVIPVLDLRHGRVVRARRGERASYAPIVTPLAKGSDPDSVARGLLDAWPATTLYVADLDAIMDGAAPNLAALERITRACPGIALWVDAGFSDAVGVADFLASGLGRPVIGSESQSDTALLTGLRDRRGALPRQPRRRSAWDRPRCTRMPLALAARRDRDDAGPRRRGHRSRIFRRTLAPARDSETGQARLHAAGGVRGIDDLLALRGAGLAGALVASALHDGVLKRSDAPGLS